MKISDPGISLTSAAPSTSAVGDAAAAGSGALAARADHRHGREAFGSGASTAVGPDQANGDGTSTSLARADHTHSGQGSGTPSTQAFSDAADAGTSGKWARSDHKHAMPKVHRTASAAHNSAWTFPSAFSSTPVVVATPKGDTGSTNGRMTTIASVSTTAVTVVCWTSNAVTGAPNPDQINVIAMEP